MPCLALKEPRASWRLLSTQIYFSPTSTDCTIGCFTFSSLLSSQCSCNTAGEPGLANPPSPQQHGGSCRLPRFHSFK